MVQLVVLYIFIDDIPETCLGQFWNSYHICVSDGKGDFLHIAFTRPDVQQGTNTNSSTWQRLFVTGRIPSTVPQRSWRHSHLATLSLALDFVNLETLITVLVPTKASANCPPRMNQQRALVRMPLDSVVLMVAVCPADVESYWGYTTLACLLESERPDSNPRRGRSKHGRKVLYGHRRDVYGAGIILGELLLRFSPHIGNGLNLNSMTPKTRTSKSFSAQGLDPQERLLNHLHFPGGRRNRKEMRREFSLRLNGGKGPNNQGSMRDAFGGLQHYGQLDFTKFNKHGADLVKHMMLWDRFKRPRAWEALQHSFFHVDPKDTQIEPPFATLLQKPVHEVPLPEEDTFDFRDDDHPIPKNIHQISFIPEERRELADRGDIMLKERFCLRNRISGKCLFEVPVSIFQREVHGLRRPKAVSLQSLNIKAVRKPKPLRSGLWSANLQVLYRRSRSKLDCSDPEDMYWYGKEGMDYIYSGAMRRGWHWRNIWLRYLLCPQVAWVLWYDLAEKAWRSHEWDWTKWHMAYKLYNIFMYI